MRKLALLFAVVLAIAPLALAQSSGNFSATAFTPACMIAKDGALTGSGAVCDTTGIPGAPPGSGGTSCNMMSATITTSNGSGVTLDIRPSLVTGLYTQTNLTKNPLVGAISSATADIGIQVCVAVDGNLRGGVMPDSCVIYDQRFQQLSSNLFQAVTNCALAGTAPAACCATNTCTPGSPEAATCTICNLELILSTLSAHNFDFVVPVAKGAHKVDVKWFLFGATEATAGSSATIGACAGPGIVTVTQMKVFNNSGALLSF